MGTAGFAAVPRTKKGGEIETQKAFEKNIFIIHNPGSRSFFPV